MEKDLGFILFLQKRREERRWWCKNVANERGIYIYICVCVVERVRDSARDPPLQREPKRKRKIKTHMILMPKIENCGRGYYGNFIIEG